MQPLVRALLDERYHLRLHPEVRPTPVYVLVQAKGGAKVKEVSAPPPIVGDVHEALKRFRKENPGKPFPGGISCTGDGCTAKAVSMTNALRQIQGRSHADRMVSMRRDLRVTTISRFEVPAKTIRKLWEINYLSLN